MENVGLTAFNVANFENYHFVLPNTVKADDVALTLTDEAGTDLGEKAKVGVVIMAGASPLEAGDRVTLIQNANGLKSEGFVDDSSSLTATQGVSLEYDLELKNDETSVYAEVEAVPAEPVQPEEPTQPEEPGQPEEPSKPEEKIETTEEKNETDQTAEEENADRA
ncbi:MAG: hypothetical protein IIW08_11150 [Clostridia bacterium]|nr:hypothetical protein [Clostridia bacterium]